MDIRILYRQLCAKLAPYTDSPRFEAQELLAGFCRLSRQELLLGEREIAEGDCRAVWQAAGRRAEGEPLQYILGEWDFYGAPFSVGPGVLIPRADTETLIEAVLEAFSGKDGLEIADLCSGSGCIALTLARELDSRVTAVENSPQALAYLRRNVQRQGGSGVRVMEDDVLVPQEGYPLFDLIVSNPPYLTGEDMAHLQREVSREPAAALYGGEDGLDFYRGIPRIWKRWLKPGGWLFFEAGMGQDTEVRRLLQEAGFQNIVARKDLGGIVRVIGGQLEHETLSLQKDGRM